MDEREIDWERLDRYVRGGGTPEERAALERWVAADPEHRALAESMRRVGHPPGEPAAPWNVRAAWQRLEREMRRADRPPLRIVRATPRAPVPRFRAIAARREPPSVWRRLAPAAALAAAALLFVASGVWRRPAGSTDEDVAAQPARELVTRRGQMATLDLADGTRVMLGAESRLRIPAGFGTVPRAAREVQLEGEGFFEVVHDSTRPFRVRTRLGTAEDLGTEFVVTAYPETHGLRVAVASGEVALLRPTVSSGAGRGRSRRPAASPPLVTLKRGDVARLDSAGTVTLTRDVDVAPLFAAARGELRLEKTPLRDAVPRVERWYDITIQVPDAGLLDRTVTGRFRVESARQAVALLALSLEARAQWDGRTVRLSRAGPRPRAP
jgi:transmembrane sensor